MPFILEKSARVSLSSFVMRASLLDAAKFGDATSYKTASNK